MEKMPADSVLMAERLRYGYADCFTVSLARNDVATHELVTAFFSAAPAWVNWLMALRNRVVSIFGLKTGERGCFAPPHYIGQQIGVFRILHIDEREVVLGEDDKHLDFRTSLFLIRHGGNASLAISSLVNTKNRLGKVYFVLVKPFHRLIVPIVARGMARQLDGGRK